MQDYSHARKAKVLPESDRLPKELIVSIDADGIQLPDHKILVPLEKITLSSNYMLSQLHENIMNYSEFTIHWTVHMTTQGGDTQQILYQKGLISVKSLLI